MCHQGRRSLILPRLFAVYFLVLTEPISQQRPAPCPPGQGSPCLPVKSPAKIPISHQASPLPPYRYSPASLPLLLSEGLFDPSPLLPTFPAAATPARPEAAAGRLSRVAPDPWEPGGDRWAPGTCPPLRPPRPVPHSPAALMARSRPAGGTRSPWAPRPLPHNARGGHRAAGTRPPRGHAPCRPRPRYGPRPLCMATPLRARTQPRLRHLPARRAATPTKWPRPLSATPPPPPPCMASPPRRQEAGARGAFWEL